MIIENERNRTILAVSISEALEMIVELSQAINFAHVHGQRATNGMAASERVDTSVVTTGFKPSSLIVVVGEILNEILL